MHITLFLGWLSLRTLLEWCLIPKRSEGRGHLSLAVMSGGFLISTAAVLARLLSAAAPGHLAATAGYCALVLGFGGRLLCTRALGSAYNQLLAEPPTQGLCTTGPYALVRHPLYGLFLLEALGLLLLSGSLISAGCAAGIAAAALWRSWAEDELLAAALPEEHRDYCQCTKRFVPFVY